MDNKTETTLSKLEALAANRYSSDDSEFDLVLKDEDLKPPVIQNWSVENVNRNLKRQRPTDYNEGNRGYRDYEDERHGEGYRYGDRSRGYGDRSRGYGDRDSNRNGDRRDYGDGRYNKIWRGRGGGNDNRRY